MTLVRLAHAVSRTQELPEFSLALIRSFNLAKGTAIIDIGGGDSKLADYLLQEGYMDVTVLDIATYYLSIHGLSIFYP